MTLLEANQKLLRVTPPVTGRMLKEDATVVNQADTIGQASDGSPAIKAVIANKHDSSTSFISPQSINNVSPLTFVWPLNSTYIKFKVIGSNGIFVHQGEDATQSESNVTAMALIPAFVVVAADGYVYLDRNKDSNNFSFGGDNATATAFGLEQH